MEGRVQFVQFVLSLDSKKGKGEHIPDGEWYQEDIQEYLSQS